MSAATATRDAPAPDDGAGEPVDVTDRGRTRIADRVVEKIVARAVAEVDRAAGVPGQVLGVRLGSTRPNTRARVDADVDGAVVTVRVSMAVRWPASVRAVARQVRGHVAERLQTLTGLRVEQVDIDVPTLLTAIDDEDRRVS